MEIVMNAATIVIPDSVSFADLALSRKNLKEPIRYKSEVLARVAKASGLVLTQLAEQPIFGELLLAWYRRHCEMGGTPDLLMELMIAESQVIRIRGFAALQISSTIIH